MASPSSTKTHVTRRRRKFKSCLFCRNRKLKCDHAEPICMQCSKRGFTKCIYSRDFNFNITAEELFEKFPNVQLVEEVTKLQTQIETEKPNLQRDPNKLQFIGKQYFSKDNKQLYGYSSAECMTNFEPTFLQETYIDKSKQIIQEFHIHRNRSTVTTETLDFEFMLPESSKYNMETLCEGLPSYEMIKLCLTHFFNSSLHDLLGVIDKKKTLDTFSTYFISDRGNQDPTSRVTQILIPPNGNIFQIAIILFLVAISPNLEATSPSLCNFLTAVTEISVNRTRNVEFCQFLVLRCFCRSYDNRLGFSNDILKKVLVNKLCESCLDLGLTDVDLIYSEEKYSASELVSLKKTFYWALLLDVHSSLEFGTQLCIQDSSLDGGTIFNADIAVCGTNVNKRRNDMLKNFLGIMRTMLQQFNQKRGMPYCNITNHTGSIQRFIETKLLPMKFYADFDSPAMTDPMDLLILGILLEALIVLNHSKKKYYHEVSAEVDNEIIHNCNLLFTVSLRSIITSHSVDEFAYPDLFKEVKGETPHLHLFLGITEEFLTRSAHHFYSVVLEDMPNSNLINGNDTNLDMATVHDSVVKIQSLFGKITQENERKLLSRMKNSDTFIASFLQQVVSFKYWLDVIGVAKELPKVLGEYSSDGEVNSAIISGSYPKLFEKLSTWDNEDIVSNVFSQFS
ncbi:similar to Saccharomyces cerevisiae YOR172W YRM1 Zn2-Cys6 zinc-finger transcription factor that activates genes involved in multidrug resistance [Maudiozyma saulgeensis]|uniref:Similar to Saccharomyces cerevisiae YOR172W YRM1 Zn2-Cys6 zinc-finger transcription factor that activates genes involved in multidrug resistance n=1 Tax=Maudiozyma saulgeensis TaxID=1789683 RepID=A0A1X7RAB7_9SACH|nr:similar to Saccharomyces cerevisiae YOR172W YRM1 Zn2-Cys6 zinc-finger transcription factor that activates genes involved in multidrug resistance [Kazachstania saulgeensis]